MKIGPFNLISLKFLFVHCFCYLYARLYGTIQPKNGALQKVGECLYRYSSNGVYYARIKKDGKEIKRSLERSDPALARRKLAVKR